MKNRIINGLMIGLGLILIGGCQDFLDVKPDKQLVVPQKLQDLQALLDDNFMNTIPVITEGGADDFYYNDADYNAISSDREKNIYLWRNTAIDGDAGNWKRMYNSILSCNVALETLEENTYPNEAVLAAQIKGMALMHRSSNFFNLLLMFAKAYDAHTANSDLGIPLRVSSDFDQVNKRNTIAACYTQIIKDLKEAANILPVKGAIATRPDRCNTYALLAKVGLFKGDYEFAKSYADSALSLNNQLIDYNTLDKNSNTPFSPFNIETLFYGTGTNVLLTSSRAKINPALYNQYENNDLRKALFFRKNTDGTYQFKGSYSGQSNATVFSGLAVDEVILIRAEALARTNKIALAMDDLNSLLKKRYQTGTFVPKTASNASAALALILAERRKELIFRAVRWYDLKRLNQASETATTLTRSVAGQTYTLSPNSKNYVYPIPLEVVIYGGLTQNE